MRKFLLFLILFGAGLAILVLLDPDRGGGAPTEEPPRAVDEAGAEEPEEPSVDTGDTGGQERPVFQAEVGGEVTFSVFDDTTGRKKYRFQADVTHVGDGEYEARNLAIDSFEEDRSVPRLSVRAKRGRLRLLVNEGRVRLGDEGRILLYDVEVIQHTGGPIAPITFLAPALECNLEAETFRSTDDSVVEVLGSGLEANGRGLLVDGRAGRFSLEVGGTVSFTDEAGHEISFFTPTDGPIVVERIGVAGEGAIEVTASDGARLDVEGDPPGRIDADSMRLFGRVSGGAIRIERAIAEGAVDARRGDEHYRGDSATVIFAEDGTLRELTLEREPRATFLVPLEGEAREPVELSGEGPLHVDLSGPVKFRMDGASRLAAPEQAVTVEAQAGIRGEYDSETGRAEIEAREDVLVVQGVASIRSQVITAILFGDAGGSVDITSTGRTRLETVGEEGTELVVVALDGMKIEKRGATWRVPIAREVELELPRERGFTAKVGVVRDLDWTNRTFVAEEGVTFESALGSGLAGRAEATGPRSIRLFGIPGEPARFVIDAEASRLVKGTFEALEIDLSENRMEARGNVAADLRTLEESVVLACAHAVFTTDEPAPGGETRFELEADNVRQLKVGRAGESIELSCNQLVIEGTYSESEGAGSFTTTLVAEDKVELRYVEKLEFWGTGERFTLDADGIGRLETTEGRQVSAGGVLPGNDVPYELAADWIQIEPGHLEAKRPRIFVDATLLPVSPTASVEPTSGITEASADRLLAHAGSLLFEGNVHLVGRDEDQNGLDIRTANLRLSGNIAHRRRDGAVGQAFRRLEAWGGFLASYEGNAEAQGEYLLATEEEVHIEGAPGYLDFGGFKLESNLIEVDLVHFLLKTERGILRAAEEKGAWALAFSFLQPVTDEQGTMLVLGSPVYTAASTTARADGAVLWIREDEWERRGGESVWGEDTEKRDRSEPPLPEKDLVPNAFRALAAGDLGEMVRSAYLEGEVEVTEDGRRSARADAVFLDLDQQIGWLRGAEITHEMDVGGHSRQVRTRADEIKTGADGSLLANKATLTTCDHDAPHYVVETGNLRLQPRAAGGWLVSLRKNKLRFANGFHIPLPAIGGAAFSESGGFEGFESEEGEMFAFETLTLGNSARFGASLGAGFESDIGGIGKGLASIVGFKRGNVKGRWKYDVHYLGSRGFLLDFGLQLREKNRTKNRSELFWLNLYSSGISDNHKDRGLVRVNTDERDKLRAWFRARGRYPLDEGEWIDLAFASQTDPGVQAEFYQKDFTRYEQRDNYLHWRKGQGENLYSARAKIRVDDFRYEVEELPAAGAYHGEVPLLMMGAVPLLYGASLDFVYHRRRAGKGVFTDDDGNITNVDIYDDGTTQLFDDGLGNRTALRVDNKQRLEAPIEVGFYGLRATPFVDAELTAWDTGIDESDNPTRAGLFAGIELSTTLHKVGGDGYFNTITPNFLVRTDLRVEESNGDPVQFDFTDQPIGGTELQLGVRSLWWKRGETHGLDLDLRATSRVDRGGGREDLNRINVLGNWRDQWGPFPVGLRHETHFNTDLNATTYTRTNFRFSPAESWDAELGYVRGLSEERLFLKEDGLQDQNMNGMIDEDEEARLFEAAQWGLRWRANEKWEFEGRQTIAVKSDGTLNSEFFIRRFAHDFVIEIGVGNRSGEGSSFEISLRPLIGWKSSRLGLSGED